MCTVTKTKMKVTNTAKSLVTYYKSSQKGGAG